MKLESLHKFTGLRPAEKTLFLEAIVFLIFTRLLTAVLPFRRIARMLERASHRVPTKGMNERTEAKRIGWAVAAVSRHWPLRTVCLGQAIAAHLMLKRRGIPSTLVLGVAHESSGMVAHAWVTSGDTIVTGDAGHQRFTVVSRISAATC